MNRLMFVVAALAAAMSAAAAQPTPAQPTPAQPAAPAQPAQTPAPAQEPTGRTIDLAEAIALATKGNIQIALGKERVASAQADVRATRTHRLPILTVKAGIQYWNDEIAAAFPQDVDMDPSTPDVPIPIVIRPQVTANAEAMIVQPITAAIVLGTLIDLNERLVDVERAQVDIQRLDVAYQAAETYLNALQLETLREIAQTSVTQLEANLTRAQALRQAEVLGDVDLLRIQAQLESVRQQMLEAELNAKTVRNALVLLLNLPDGTVLNLQPIDTTPPTVEWSEADAVSQARRQRPEARQAAAAAKAADLGIKVAQAQYLPNIVAVADYQHTFNAGDFGATADAAFIGLNLEWNLWDWGERKAQIDKARSASRSAKLAVELTDDALSLDVRTKYAAATAKRQTLDVAESGLKAAEEAYRLQQVRFKEGVATTTDVLDAESEVGRARAQATIGRYQYLIAWMALVRAVGQVPEAPAAAPSSPATAPSAP